MDPISILKKHSEHAGAHLRLNASLLEEISKIKLPFTSKNYYAFCDKYITDEAHEYLFIDGEEKYFREIATDYETLKYISYLRGLYKKNAVFCDIGCGIGNIVLYAGKSGFDSFGYEINTGLKPIHKKAKIAVEYGDILKMDLSRLNEADVIYLYRPINDDRLMNKLFGLIYKHSRDGAIILYNYPHARSLKNYRSILLGEYEDMVILVKT